MIIPKKETVKYLLKNLVFSILIVAFLLLSMEVTLRISWYSPSPPPTFTKETLDVVEDPLMGWRKKSGGAAPESTGPVGTERGSYRILLLGDSFSFCYPPSGIEDRFSCLLDEMLGEDVEVINAGVGGYSTAQELLYFMEEGYKYKSNMVILQFFWNDVAENAGINTVARPVYKMEDGKRVPVKINFGNLIFLQDIKEDEGPGRRFFRKKLKANKITTWLNYHSSLFNALKALYLGVGFLQYASSRYSKIDMNLTVELIETLMEKVRSKGINRFVVAIAPGTDTANENLLIPPLIDFLTRNNIPFIYPVEEFRRNKNSYYIPVDGHFSKEGHKRFAEHLYKLVIEMEPTLAKP